MKNITIVWPTHQTQTKKNRREFARLVNAARAEVVAWIAVGRPEVMEGVCRFDALLDLADFIGAGDDTYCIEKATAVVVAVWPELK